MDPSSGHYLKSTLASRLGTQAAPDAQLLKLGIWLFPEESYPDALARDQGKFNFPSLTRRVLRKA
jgi:hypothetical protein